MTANPNRRGLRKCVFFDRDGIVNRSPGVGYVERWEDFELLPDFVAALRIARRHGFEAVIVTNQRGVALGRVSLEAVHDIHRRLQALLKSRFGLAVLDVRTCPHERGECECRKPKPGMLTAAAAEHGIDLGASWMVGDQERDIEAGRSAGCRTVLVGGGDSRTAADYRVSDLRELAVLLERVLREAREVRTQGTEETGT